MRLCFTKADGFNTVWPIYHMKILCDSGLVVSRQEGKWTHYRLSETGKDEAVELLLALTTPNTERVCECPACDK